MTRPTIVQFPIAVAKLVYRTTTRTVQFFRDAKVHRDNQRSSEKG